MNIIRQLNVKMSEQSKLEDNVLHKGWFPNGFLRSLFHVRDVRVNSLANKRLIYKFQK